MKLNDDEIVVRESRCNHRGNHLDLFDWAGGKVLLTKKRLTFRPNSFNLKNLEHSIKLEDIISIQAKHNDFISNKFTILLRNGSIEEFRVPKRKDWLKAIEQAVKENRKRHGEDWNISTTDLSTPEKSKKWYIKVAIQVLFWGLCVSILAFIFQVFLF
jgi:hypothetical protein